MDNNDIYNPPLGGWLKIDDRYMVICTTGQPFKTPGTSMPLVVEKVYGDSDVITCGQAIFALTQLAWTAPDRPARHPLVISYTDRSLEALATDYDEEEAELGPDELIYDDVETDDETEEDVIDE